jgi:hypothetical protein
VAGGGGGGGARGRQTRPREAVAHTRVRGGLGELGVRFGIQRLWLVIRNSNSGRLNNILTSGRYIGIPDNKDAAAPGQ